MSTNHLGIGVMLGMLGGNEETVSTVNSSINKTIKQVYMKNDVLIFEFDDNTSMKVFDSGQSCCEHRYMMTDDDLSYYKNTKLLKIELRKAPNLEAVHEEHEVQFLLVTTGLGVFTMATHNVHNGYYGGFWIAAKPITT